MRVECECCVNTQCRCFESIEEAMFFEGYICSNRCFVISSHGNDEFLDEIIDKMKLKVPLESLDDSVFDEIVSKMIDDVFDQYECPTGEPCIT